MGFWQTLGKIIGKVNETVTEVADVSVQLQALEVDIQRIGRNKFVSPDDIEGMLAKIDSIRRGVQAIGK